MVDTELHEHVLSVLNEDDIVELEKDLVRIPSYTSEEHRLAEFIADLLSSEGIEVELQEVIFPFNERERGLLRKSSNRSSFNVVGRIRGSGNGPSLMFNGHMDHGPIEGRDAADFSDWQHDPWTPVVEGDYLYGKACQDEKGGICAFLSAARAIKRAGIVPRGDLIFAPLCGHKTHSIGAKALVDAGVRADMVINSENTGNCIIPLGVGVITAEVHVFAMPVHPNQREKFPESRQFPTTIQRSMQVIEALAPDCTPHRQDTSWLTFTPHPELKDFPEHRIDGVESYGYQHQSVHIMFRTLPGQDERTVRDDLDRVMARLQANDPSFRSKVETRLWGPPIVTPYEAPVVQTLARFHEQITGDPPNVGPAGRYGNYGDGGVFAAAGMSTCHYGPGGGLSDLEYQRQVLFHEIPPDERISIPDLVACARVMTLTAVDLCN